MAGDRKGKRARAASEDRRREKDNGEDISLALRSKNRVKSRATKDDRRVLCVTHTGATAIRFYVLLERVYKLRKQPLYDVFILPREY